MFGKENPRFSGFSFCGWNEDYAPVFTESRAETALQRGQEQKFPKQYPCSEE
jgi:hypothetical protein